MKSMNLSYSEFKKLIKDGVILFENRRKYEHYYRDIGLLVFFMLSLTMLSAGIIGSVLIIDLSKGELLEFFKASIFFIILLFFCYLLLVNGMAYHALDKYPEKIFWPYFMKRYLKLVLLGPIKVEGTQYIYHGFITKGLSFRRVSAFFEVHIRKDIHKKAMELNEKVYDVAFDKHGNRKFVSMDGVVEDADEDVILVARFLASLYALYGKDIDKIYMEDKNENCV